MKVGRLLRGNTILLASLVVLSASRWLLEGVLPGSGTTLPSAVLGALLAAAAFSIRAAGRLRRMRTGRAQRSGATPIMAGALLLGAPAVAGAIAGTALNANSATLAMVLVPVIVAVAGPVVSTRAQWDVVGRLWPGLAGLAGLLLLVPQPAFSQLRPWLGLAALPLLPGIAATVYQPTKTPVEHAEKTGDSPWTPALSALLAAMLFALAQRISGHADIVRLGLGSAAMLDGVLFYLSLRLLEGQGATGWSAQFLWVPLLTILEGVVLLHPLLDTRSWVGMALLLLGSVRQQAAGSEGRAAEPGLFREGVPLS